MIEHYLCVARKCYHTKQPLPAVPCRPKKIHFVDYLPARPAITPILRADRAAWLAQDYRQRTVQAGGFLEFMMTAENSAVTQLPASASNTNRRHDRVPPHHRSQVPWDSSAQQALLGSILLRGGMLPDVIAVLSESPDVFWGDADALVYSAMIQVYNAGKPLDGVTLTHQLQSDGHYDRIGGFDYLESRVNGVLSAANWRAYAESVRARHRQRLEWQAGQNLQAGNLSSVQYLQTIQQINARFADDGPDRWPDPPEEAAYYALAGDIVRTIAPHTESDPAAVLLHILVLFGNMVGRGPHFTVDGARHGLNIFAVCCGESSKARKGTAGSQALRLLTDGPGAPSNCVELMPTGESDAGMMADDISGRGIAVPI